MYTEDGRRSPAMASAIAETDRRRLRQMEYNELHNVVPTSPGMRFGSPNMASKSKDYGTELLTLLQGTKAAAKAPTRLSEAENELQGSDLELYGEIRAWRGAKARSTRRRPFMIITEAVMRELARVRPTSTMELLAIKGIGPKKAAAFAEDLLRVLQEYSDRETSTQNADH